MSGKYRPKYSLDHAEKSSRDAVKISSKRVIYKTAEATDDLIGNKLLTDLQKLQLSMLKKYLKKDMFFQKKEKKLSMN